MRRVVIADAGPLIALARVDRLNLLPRLFGSVTVTPWVMHEVLQGGEFVDTALLRAASKEPWFQTTEPAQSPQGDWQAACRELINLYQIDMGEATAMVLAQQLTARGELPLLLIDDARGRNAARHACMAMLGTAGVLVLAKKAQAIEAVRPLLLALRQQGYYLSDNLIAAACTQAGE